MLILAFFACTDAEPTPAPRRTEGVAAAAPKIAPPDEFCDQWATADVAKPYVWPPLHAEPPSDVATWRWVDVWATWCAPCIAEMPMIEAWQERLASEGVKLDLQLVSVDADPTDLERFYQKHADFRPTSHVATVDAVPAWFTSIGVPEGTAIPLAVFVDPQGKVRCARAGQLHEADYATVKAILQGS